MRKVFVMLLLLSPIPLFVAALFLGSYQVPAHNVLRALFGGASQAHRGIVVDVRLPRVLLALLVGAALSASGASLQAVCRNPLVSPYILGLSSGAAFGAALSMTLLPAAFPLQLSAFLFGLLAVAVAYFIARAGDETPTVSLVLAGVITAALFSALLSILQFLTDPHRLSEVVFWMMGSFGRSDWSSVKAVVVPIVGALVAMFLMRWRLNVLSLGAVEAKSVGMDVEANRGAFIVASTLASASAISVCGIVGWVGLMVPHIVRMLVGPDHKVLLPLCITFGAAFMLAVDTLARCITDYDLPVGIISTLAGVPFFAYLLKKTRGGGWR